jgi:hypothetical protein
MPVDTFIERVAPEVHKDFRAEKFQERYGKKTKETDLQMWKDSMKKPVFIQESPLKALTKISNLSIGHPAKDYIISRQLPKIWHSKIFYVEEFKRWTNSLVPEKFDKESLTRDAPRIIIPFIDTDGKLFGYQGRAMDDHGLRYITIMLDEYKPKLFNLDQCDRSKKHFVLEGPFDSMFIENSMAMCGGSMPDDMITENTIFVFDNEPRHKETIQKIAKTIKNGYNVAFYPDKYKEKDVNDIIKTGVLAKDIRIGLQLETYNGLSAELKLNQWKKI